MPTLADLPSVQSAHAEERTRMVERQLARRGITDANVLAAMSSVPREAFLGADVAEFAYADSALPIDEGQTISQPYVVALMAQLAELTPEDRVLEIGTGSGYAAAVYAHIAREVFTVERHTQLAASASDALRRLGMRNVTVLHGDGTLGWADEAPFDAIIVAAGAPTTPESLKRQLSVGGRLVIPVSANGYEDLLVVRRETQDGYRAENAGAVRFVRLIGVEGWSEAGDRPPESGRAEPAAAKMQTAPQVMGELELVEALADAVEELPEIDDPEFAAPFDRLKDATVVGLGEATHGTSEFYRARAAITRRLVEQHGFNVIALEADWPDAARLDRYVRDRKPASGTEPAFMRFPAWMWRNEEMRDFIEWLRAYNSTLPMSQRVSVHGLDLYALGTSIGAVIGYLEEVDPEAASAARERYACLTPWQKDPTAYGRAALRPALEHCEQGVLETLGNLLRERARYMAADGDEYLDAEGNAHLVAAAEEYYRTLYYSDAESWNLRDRHMFDTLERILAARGGSARAAIWAHNSHIGDAQATELGIVRGEINIGQLCRERYGSETALVGFGTYDGEVMAAHEWGGPGEVYRVRRARHGSLEELCHETAKPRFLLDLGRIAGTSLAHTLLGPRLHRAIGVIYRPDTERASHYLEASLPGQFDHYVWFDRTTAVRPLAQASKSGPADTWPFGI